MSRSLRLDTLVVASSLALSSAVVCFAQGDGTSTTVRDTIQVVATRVAEDPAPVPSSITVVSGDELRARGARDLAEALAWVAGVAIAPGGDGGPASSVPELWGLREFDAFLLVVDGVPWGGAFNPALASLDLTGVERIEILRGSAPVMFGATSFVGVIHVVHSAAGAAGAGDRQATLAAGSRSSGAASIVVPFASGGDWRQSLIANVEKRGYEDERAGYDKGHLLYRAGRDLGDARLRLDADLTFLTQEPSSPHPREGRVLSNKVPLDANHNPGDAKQDENRLHLVGGYDRPWRGGDFSSTLALTAVDRDIVKGFLSALTDAPGPNAAGFSQEQEEVGAYLDLHWARKVSEQVRVVVGFDHLYGMGESEGENFRYHASLNGRSAQRSSDVAVLEETELEDERNFSGVYGQVEWTPVPRLRVEVGARLNHTAEDREAEAEEPDEIPVPGEEEGGSDSRTITRGSGVVGVSYQALATDRDSIWLFADLRDAFKPSAIDFGPEAEAVEILKPETATSYEVGAKGRHAADRLEWQVSAFQMDFENLVMGAISNGLPVLVNGGKERFKGYEIEGRARPIDDLSIVATYAHHDSRFRDFIQVFDGVPTQLAGKRFEMAPQELASLGVTWFPAEGLTGWIGWNRIGERFLNKRNTAPAEAYDTWAAGIGYRFGMWNLSLVGENLSDERPPIAESELGDAQYYRLPARHLELRADFRF
jgi:outer membrane receptor protein involved in Fe transport